ncbi:carboxypeptidase-like regulatory domain-containing protein [uncultured Psychroserpens sp.]|uniref:carboxypeptidase-like regulatory domain-containing protein n=1 Tax=uncultured Psychroserpens sp. TaxID=255436 RepID=UPI0026149EEA|nr:carboxypeptidase-like regulatory domain-containing protein [uncultured Psychroserpens sp.]
MKTKNTFTKNPEQSRLESVAKKVVGTICILMFTLLATNPVYAQSDNAQDQFTVKGIVSDEEGPLPGVNVTLKYADVGTSTDRNGAFTFPKALKPGDILVFSYLGYETQEIKIKKNTRLIKLLLTTDLVEILGAVNDDKPYKSKRKN